jgi:hypothetical protein
MSDSNEIYRGQRLAIRDDEPWHAEYCAANREFNAQSRKFSQNNIQYGMSVDDAFKRYKSIVQSSVNAGVFAYLKPRAQNGRFDEVVNFAIGDIRQVFGVCRASDVRLEETLYPRRPTRVYFDLCLKRGGWIDGIEREGHPGGMTWVEILSGVLDEALRDSTISRKGTKTSMLFRGRRIDMNERDLENRRGSITREMCKNYFEVSRDEWDEDVCLAGYGVMKSFVEKKLLDLVEVGEGVVGDVLGMSACGVDDFRVRLICKDLYCESPVLSMPQLTHELARAFLMDNARWLFEYRCMHSTAVADTSEFRFRLRALKLDCMADVTWQRKWFRGGNFEICPTLGDGGVGTGFYYVGYGDTPFDEGAYGLVRSVGLPGVRTLSGGVVFVPVVMPLSHRWLGGSVTVATMTWLDWSRYLVNAPASDSELIPSLLRGVSLSDSYAKKRSWFVARDAVGACDCRVGFRSVGLREGARYTEQRRRQGWLEITSTEKKQAEIYLWYPSGALNDIDEDELPLDHLVRTETGERKAIKDCEEGEWVFHCLGQGVDGPPSARVFDGGLYCKVCDRTLLTPVGCPWEEAYPFLADEMTADLDATAYMPDVDWDVMLSKKYVVIEGPMGSGKTFQLTRLLNYLDQKYGELETRVLVVSFRSVLSIQQAHRFGIKCYLDLTKERMRQDPPQLTCCLNSLIYLSKSPKYDVLVLDECGLIRRHFMSSTMGSCLRECYDALNVIQRNARNVIMLQEGISLEDVRFYTEADDVAPDDRGRVSASAFLKPICIHPIQWTYDMRTAIGKLVEEYKASFEDHIGEGGVVTKVCTQPIMVFCSKASVCERIVVMLIQAAEDIGADTERVKGLWAAVRDESDFCRRFTKEPNLAAMDADVVVCTSTVGAGFSVEKHFHRFFAFLFTRILDFGEERQFIQRLRFQMLDEVGLGAIRQSYLYIQKGGGVSRDYERVVALFAKARKALVAETQRRVGIIRDVDGIPALERVQARVAVETAATRAQHEQLWLSYGENLDSAFEEFETNEDLSNEGRLCIQRAGNTFQKSLVEHLVEPGGPSEVEHMEVSDALNLLIQTKLKTANRSFDDTFGKYSGVAQYFVHQDLTKTKIKSLSTNKTSFSRWVVGFSNVASWLVWNYAELSTGVKHGFFAHLQKGLYKTSAYKNVAHFHLASLILPMVFGSTDNSYCDVAGVSPFYVGGSVTMTVDLQNLLQGIFCPQDTESVEVTTAKSQLRLYVMALREVDSDILVYDIFLTLDTCRSFLKSLLTRIGLDVPPGGARKRVRRELVGAAAAVAALGYTPARQTVLTVGSYKQNLLFALCSRSCRKHLLPLLPHLLGGDHHLDVSDRDVFWGVVEDFKKKCDEIDVPHGIILERPGVDMLRHLAGNRRRAEVETGAAVAEESRIGGMGDTYEVEAGAEEERHENSAEVAELLMTLADNNETARLMNEAAGQEFQDEETIGSGDEDEDDGEEDVPGSSFVEHEAQE